ncbi:hypothetical protein ColLi_12329 [Colletotrichum liriopes]|uniref:Uncharacterized protein n=1 Tax=Colletotrichum liriopes TaxID=708192 RepID=A0AA37GY68_9PEZI|nr:hypothetical protein ColLi_12329 [Colletotrichum liriopes]
MVTSILSAPLTRDEFIDARNHQDQQLNADIKSTIKQVELQSQRAEARSHNSSLKNPLLRISAVPAYRDNRLVLPDGDLFPSNAKEFYALRRPSVNSRRLRQLAYLVDFYDVEYNAWALYDQDDYDYEECDEDLNAAAAPRPEQTPRLALEDAVRLYPELAVDALEGILRLNEENFINFRERALALRRQSPPQPVKRQQASDPTDGAPKRTPPPKRVHKPIVGRALPKTVPDPAVLAELYHGEERGDEDDGEAKSGNTMPVWDDGSGRRRFQQHVLALAARGPRSSDGSPTNAETLSREHRSSPRAHTPPV